MSNSIFVTIFGNEKPLTRSLLTAQTSIGQFTKSVTGASGISGAAFGGIAAAAGLAAVASGKAFLSFEDQMTKSTAIMGDVNADLRADMERTARDVAKSSTYGASEAAEAYYFLASAGLDAKQSMAALPAVTKFATAGAFDLARATDLVTDAQSALGLSVDDSSKNLENMTRVSDVLVKANTLANASVEQFSESLTNKAGASIKEVGKDIEEGVAVLAAFADQGVKGADAGTALSIVMRDLQTKALKNEDAWRQLGISAFDANGEMRNMGDIVADLEGRLDGMSDAQRKTTLLQLGFTDKSVSFIQALLGQSEAIKGYEEALRSAGGTTQEVADKQLESLSNRLKVGLIAPLEDAAITAGKLFVPALVSAAEVVGRFVAVVDDLAAGLAMVPGEIYLIGAAIGALVIPLGRYQKALKALSGNPIIAGLTVVAGIMAKIGADADAATQRADDLRAELERIGSLAVANKIAAIADESELLAETMSDLGINVSDVTAALELGRDGYTEWLDNLGSDLVGTEKTAVANLNLELHELATAYFTATEAIEAEAEATRIAAGHSRSIGTDFMAQIAALEGLDTASTNAATSFHQVAKTQEEIASAGREAAEGLKQQRQETMRAASEIHNLWSAEIAVRDAEQELIRLRDEGKEGTDEWITATLRAAQATAELDYAQTSVAVNLADSEAAFRSQLEALGLTADQIGEIIRQIKALNDTDIAPKTFLMRVLGSGATGPGFVTPSGQEIHHSGGVAGKPRSNEVQALLEKGEVIRTPEQEAALSRRLQAPGGWPENIQVNLHLDTEVVARALINRELGLA